MKLLLLAIVLMAATWLPAQTSVVGAGGSATQPVVSKSANYTATTADFSAANTLIFNCSGSCDATLPSPAASNGLYVAVKNNGATSIFVMPNGLTLDGNAAPVLVAPGNSVHIWSNGANYFSSFGQVANQPTMRRWSREDSALATLIVIGTSVSTTANSINATITTASESFFENLATSAVLNNAADSLENTGKWGIGSALFNIKFSGRFGFDDAAAGVTTSRVFMGIIDQNATTANYFGGSSSDAPTQNALVFRCSSNVPDTNWMAMVTKGAAATVVSTGVVCDTSNHTFAIQEHGGNTAYFYIDGVMRVCIGADTGCTTAGANYPPFTSARMMSGMTTLAAAVHNFHFFWMQMESDF